MFKIGSKKKFRLFGSSWVINFKRKVESSGEDKHWVFGNTCMREGTINISVNNEKDVPLSRETIHTTALHELVHSILTSGQYLEETSNEPLVEWIARSLQSLYEQKVIQHIMDN